MSPDAIIFSRLAWHVSIMSRGTSTCSGFLTDSSVITVYRECVGGWGDINGQWSDTVQRLILHIYTYFWRRLEERNVRGLDNSHDIALQQILSGNLPNWKTIPHNNTCSCTSHVPRLSCLKIKIVNYFSPLLRPGDEGTTTVHAKSPDPCTVSHGLMLATWPLSRQRAHAYTLYMQGERAYSIETFLINSQTYCLLATVNTMGIGGLFGDCQNRAVVWGRGK